MLAILFVLGVGFISDTYRIHLSNVEIILLDSSVAERQCMGRDRAREFVVKVKERRQS